MGGVGVEKIPYAYVEEMTLTAKRTLSLAIHDERLFPGKKFRLVQDPSSTILSPEAISSYPAAYEMLVSQFLRLYNMLPKFGLDTLFLDIETHNAEKRWDMPFEKFFRLGQYAWGEGDVVTTTCLDEVLQQVSKAKTVIAHNGHTFDFSVLLGDDALHDTFAGKLFDTWTFATVNFPAPNRFTHANGHTYVNSDAPGNARRWYSLENLSHQFGFRGKYGSLADLAARHNPPKTKRADLDFGLIPLDDPEFLEYAKQDIVGLRELCRSMFAVKLPDDYDRRMQRRAAVDAQMTRNGVRLDARLAQQRVDEAEAIMQETLDRLVEQYGFPSEGKMPWRTTKGKAAIMSILASEGITPETVDWPKTATGNPSLSGDALKTLTEGTPVEALGASLAALQGQRPLAAQALTYLAADGRVHPEIEALQRSGRTSITGPGLTTWGSRTEVGTREKEYFIATPGRRMVEFDLSNADQRAVAFMSGDKEYAKRFLPGVDGHELTGRIVFGDAAYDSDPHHYRETAKAISHAYAYGASAKKLAATSKQPLEITELFVERMAQAYPRMIAWQQRVRYEGSMGFVKNLWGRKMPVTSDRSYTQSPALLGQSSTTELLYDTLFELYNRAPGNGLQYVLFPVHDALVCEFPEDEVEEWIGLVQECAYQKINGIEIFVEAGTPAQNWREAMH